MSLAIDLKYRRDAFTLAAHFASEGKLTVLFGRSGSGKTTLINLIAGLLRRSRPRGR